MKKILLLIIIVSLLKQFVWIALIPMWQTPDEQAHFAQIQNIAEENKIGKNTSSAEIEISEKFLKVRRDNQGNNSFTYHPEYRIEYTDSIYGKYESLINSLPRKNRSILTFKEATGYPPLYYQFSAVGYKSVYNAGLIERVFRIRIFQLLIYLFLIGLYYKMARLLVARKISNYFLVIILFLPMFSFVFSGITSDNLMNLLFPSVIYIGLLVIGRGFKIKYFFLFALIFIVGMKTKPHFIIALPIFSFAVFIKTILTRRIRLLCLLIVSFIVFFIVSNYQRVLVFQKTGYISNIFPDIGSIPLFNPNQKTRVLDYFIISLVKTYRETLPWFWGIFRWLSFSLDRWYYRILNALTIVSLVSGATYIIKKIKGKKDILFWQLVFLATSILIYGFVLFFWDYLFFLSHDFSFGIQGRYYFPVLFSIIFLIFYFVQKIIPGKLMTIFAIIVNSYALFRITSSYYDVSSVRSFIIQASQYKPWFFKEIGLIVLLLAYFMILSFFLIQLIRDKK